MPHLNIDPIPVAMSILQAFQHVVSRETDPLGSTVISGTNRIGEWNEM